ncbi:hypothetical protein JW933_01935 [candidate division FCPU426 bacterium]|nr:hypothetical protein [candidate division FCPU426 bacterium]
MKNKYMCIAALLVGGVMLTQSAALAGKGCQCSKGKKEMNMEEKFFHKTQLILSNSQVLGLSDKQAQDIKDLKIAVEKSLITRQADIDVVATDIKSKLQEDAIDVAGVNQLVDKKYDLKKAKTRYVVESLAKLKGSLSSSQLKKMKDLYKDRKK